MLFVSDIDLLDVRSYHYRAFVQSIGKSWSFGQSQTLPLRSGSGVNSESFASSPKSTEISAALG